MTAKQLAAEKAVTYIKEGMIVGLGTGSTAAFAIEAIGKLVQQGLSITAVASSRRSEEMAESKGIKLVSFADIKSLDLYIDGADEVDKNFNLIKGGGGALLREKILAFNSRSFIVIVDRRKLVEHLGAFPLPVEVTAFAIELTMQHLKQLGCTPTLRQQNGFGFITDNNNKIIDCSFSTITEVDTLHLQLKMIPGVVETGLFPRTMVSKLIVADESGEVNVTQAGKPA